MEDKDFEKIKEISLKEAKEILPNNIAYLTMNDGQVIIVNGLDHKKFEKREKEYDEWIEEQSRTRTGLKNFDMPLMKIQEDTEENERNSNLINQGKNLYKNNNIQVNLEQKYYQEPIPMRENYQIQKNNFQNIRPMQNPNNNFLPYNNNGNQRKIYSFPVDRNNGNMNMMNMPEEDNYIRVTENDSYLRFRPNINSGYTANRLFRPNIPLTQGSCNQRRDIMNKNGINKYVRYNNHSYVEIKDY